MVTERQARMALCALTPLGQPNVVKALGEFGAVELWRGFLAQPETSWGRRAVAVDVAQLERATQGCGSRFLMPGDEEWPASLAGLSGVEVTAQTGEPIGLWVKGRPLTELGGGVAIVGSRACTTYGEHAAVTFAADLGMQDRPVISGLAYGVDAAAHLGVLGVRGTTVAVVASGVDEPYPVANARLAQRIVEAGALVSELPPGYRPTRYAFLARNRIIAALADAVVVVEAAARSGAKNTASWANALGRHVLAIPGPITSSLSATPHKLIRDGEAILATSADDVLAVLSPLGTVGEPSGRGKDRPIDQLPLPLMEIREAVGAREQLSAAQLSARTGQSMMDALAHAAELVESGWLEEASGLFSLPGRQREG
ncbi:DNA-processing protein DprA [Tessaracoccus lubricantis]|uniref:DNA-processing protein DprA n=1 Tax=Tessaracoccus lubricantis TaxID=545543 RepID=A0ABP9F3J3_9ACTN